MTRTGRPSYCGAPSVAGRNSLVSTRLPARKTDIAGSLHTATPPHRDISEHSTLYLRRAESIVWNRRLFRIELANKSTLNGDGAGARLEDPLFGIGPSDTSLGDRVCILLGCTVPVILGEGKRKGVSRVVGEAYVHGIMDGEAMYLDTTHGETFVIE